MLDLSNVKVALPSGSGFGWGVCGTNLTSRLVAMGASVAEAPQVGFKQERGTVLQAIGGPDFSMTVPVFGDATVGYGFIENTIYAQKFFPVAYRLWSDVISGSSWMQSELDLHGGVCLQGVDPEVFRYIEPQISEEFTVGSFGKFEYRKGQDVVLAAMKLFKQRHPEVKLVSAWENKWPQLIEQFQLQKDCKIRFDMRDFHNQQELFMWVASDAGYHGSDFTMGYGLTSEQMAKLYAKCDVALFPNRCEAGQNLCLSEALACGTPCIVTDATGHRDITLQEDYPCDDLLLLGGSKYVAKLGNTELGEWHNPCLEEILSNLEYAYRQRDKLRVRRKAVAEFGSRFTWDESAKQMASLLF